MKATVMESKNGKAVILTEDGMFREVKGNYAVGWEFDYKANTVRSRKMTSRIAAAAACLFMMLSMGTYSYQNLMVYATVTLHGTAPIQLELNRQDKVIGVKAIDASGEALAEQLLDSGIRGEYFQDAVARAEQMMMAQNNSNDQAAVAPQIQCKSSDKMKALADILMQEEPSATGGEQGTTATTTTEPEKPSDVSAQEGTEPAATSTEDPTTQPSSEGDITPQEEDPTDVSVQEEEQDDPEDMTVQEDAPADAAPADEPAADETSADEPAADANNASEEAPATEIVE